MRFNSFSHPTSPFHSQHEGYSAFAEQIQLFEALMCSDVLLGFTKDMPGAG